MKIKYMLDADQRDIPAGDALWGEYPDGIEETVVWSRENNHIVDTDDYPNVSEDAWALILEHPDEFKDVTGMKRVPLNLHQQRYQGLGGRSQSAVSAGVSDPDAEAEIEAGGGDVAPKNPQTSSKASAKGSRGGASGGRGGSTAGR